MAAHKHAEVIKAWADGVEIECMTASGWQPVGRSPSWSDGNFYRIKPAEPERAVVKTEMTADQLFEYFVGAPGGDNAKACIVVANKAIQHALDRGQIVTREEFDRAVEAGNDRAVRVAKAVYLAMRESETIRLSEIIESVK